MAQSIQKERMVMNDLYEKAKEIVISTRQATASFLERKLKVSHEEVLAVMQELEKNAVISRYHPDGAWNVLIKRPADVPRNLEPDDLYELAKSLALGRETISAEDIQQGLDVGYARAAHLIDLLESHGVIESGVSNFPRRVMRSGS